MKKYINLQHVSLICIIFIAIYCLILIFQTCGILHQVLALFHIGKLIILGFLLSWLLQPFIDRMPNIFKGNIKVVMVYVIVFLIIILFLGVLIPLIYEQMHQGMKYMNLIKNKIFEFYQQYPTIMKNIPKYIPDVMNVTSNIFMNQVSAFSKQILSGVWIILISFFFSCEFSFMKKMIYKYTKKQELYTYFYETFCNIVFQYVKGTFYDMVFIVVGSGIILYIFQFPNFILYAFLLAFLNLFPYIGATIGLLLIALSSFLTFGYFPWMMLLVLWMFQQIEANIIQPFIFHKMMHVKAILLFVSFMIFEELLGIVGMLLSPIFAALIQLVIVSYMHAYHKKSVGKWDDVWVDFDEAMGLKK